MKAVSLTANVKGKAVKARAFGWRVEHGVDSEEASKLEVEPTTVQPI